MRVAICMAVGAVHIREMLRIHTSIQQILCNYLDHNKVINEFLEYRSLQVELTIFDTTRELDTKIQNFGL
jgi:hypothetical protein